LNVKNSQGPETAIWLGAAVDALRVLHNRCHERASAR
jgi:hypothetical protein